MTDMSKNFVDPLRQELAAALLPGVGFFGHAPETALDVPIDAVIDRMEIAIEAPRPELINLQEIRFFGEDGQELDRASLCEDVRLSTIYGGKTQTDVMSDFLAGRMLHSCTEERPKLDIRLVGPTRLRRIVIANRGDVYGGRSRHVVLRAFRSDELVARYENLSMTKLLGEMKSLLDVLGLEEPGLGSREELASFVRDVRNAIRSRIEDDRFEWEAGKIRSLLPLYETHPEVSAFHILVIAHAVLAEWEGKDILETHRLRPFGHILSTDLSLDRLRQEIERLLDARGHGRDTIVIARHHIHKSRLLGCKDQYLAAMRRLVGILAEAGVTAMLGYGTLLGAVRDKGFMAHDDDVDLITFDGSTSQEETAAGKLRIAETLQAHGIRVRESGFWHMHAVVDGLVIDLFPAWHSGGMLHLQMEQLKIRAVPAEFLLPAGQIELYGQTFPAPANPPAFLEDRYGSGWTVANPYYEWPWPVQRILAGQPEPIAAAHRKRARIQRRHFGRLCRVAWGQKVRRGPDSPPMNCIPIIEVAHQTGYDAVELDVRLSADDVPILAHDDRLFGPGGEIDVTTAPAERILRFELGQFDGAPVFIPTLEDALARARTCGLDVQIDWRIARGQAAKVQRLREAADRAGFDPARLQFCVPSMAHAQALIQHFPESVLMWKTYRSFAEADDYFLDEAKALGLDGVMIALPKASDDLPSFMQKLRDRNLRVLLFIHSGHDVKLREMIEAGVDYVTTLGNDLPSFSALDGSGRKGAEART